MVSAGRSLARYAQAITRSFIATHVLPATRTMRLQAAATKVICKSARALQKLGVMQTRPATATVGDI